MNQAAIWMWLLFLRLVESEGDLPTYAVETGLRNALMKNYDLSAEPRTTPNESVNVVFDLSLQNIGGLDENTEILTTNVWIHMYWTDERLKWSVGDYPGVQSLTVPRDSVWKPDIIPFNSDGAPYKSQSTVPVVVTPDGKVSVVEHNVLQTSCPMDLTYFPFDEQHCFIKFGSLTHNGLKINLTTRAESVHVSNYSPNTLWDLMEAPAKRNVFIYDCCPEPYIDYTATLTIKRRPGLLLHLYIGPAVCFGLMTPFVFLLPANGLHKLALGGSLLISQVLTVNALMETLPVAHFRTPRIAFYLLANIVLLSISLALSTLIINLWNRSQKAGRGVPTILKTIFLGGLGRLCCVRLEDYIDQEPPEHCVTNDDTSGDSDSASMVKQYSRVVGPAEWRQLAAVLDRVLFVLFLVCSLIIMAAMIPFK